MVLTKADVGGVADKVVLRVSDPVDRYAVVSLIAYARLRGQEQRARALEAQLRAIPEVTE